MTRNPNRRRMITIYVAVVLLAAFVAAGMFVRVPYVALGPGPTVNTLGTVDTAEGPERVVKVTGAVDPDPKGNLNLTTVSLLDGLTLFQALGKWVSPSAELQPRESYYKPGQSEDEVRQENLAQMSSSEDNATLAAFNYLKKPTAVGVTEVADKSPSSGALADGDRITSIGGTPTATMEQVAVVLAHHKPGDTVDVDFVRGGTPQHAAVTLAKRPDDPAKAFLGISMRSVPADPKLDVTFDVGDIGGPSAGTMMTLAIIDQMTPGDLSHGEFVAGTGTIDPEGQVGEIGGIDHKVRAAKDAGATVFLVPAGNCSLASSKAPDGIELIKVETLSGAVDALNALGTDAPRPHC
ncbi:PDZ domain-containing protein [Gordonia sp. HY002]|uniref:YlbL family protein n=1 Tax=Gordonia zhenghanii TaxID=2911516 RepID=UPI001EF03371|nr:PDZ domain-containing protein [Gordonia zhenghanii]MCF8571197.1 PDZ domain-containing protein [Gordonia zhenghanii]MCF8606465.1 PDZ domain-containing protein [Gordonia zhenghanii]